MRRTPAERLYALLLWAHPPAFRRACGDEILQFVRTASEHGPVRPTLLTAGRDGLGSLAREWTSALAGGYTMAPDEDLSVYVSHVGADYFRAIGTRLVSGRSFGAQDGPGTPPVGIINEAMAKKY